MVKVKICGITCLDDALMAAAAGADALGFVFHPASPRHVTHEQAAAIIRHLPPFIQTVGLFVNEGSAIVNETADRCGLDIIQLHGEESPEYCAAVRRRVIKAFRIKDQSSLAALDDYRAVGCLLDAWSPAAHGGTGQSFNWEYAAQTAVDRAVVLAGGLNPDNVAEAVGIVRPYAVDVSSGVESSPGRKDAELVRQFISNARRYHA